VTLDLATLDLSDAVELFRRRAAVQRPAQTADDEGLVELCRSLDGLPLAIELAAARTKTLRVEEITRRLDDRFTLLRDPTSQRPERRRSLRSTIRWSYDLLFPDDQRGLCALAAFSGGASLPALESVLAALDVPTATTLDVVTRLASRSLLIVDEDPASAGGTRYRLLDSIRAFALEAATEAEISERAHEAHAAWIAEAADVSTEGVRSGRQAEHLSFASRERTNIDAALAWCSRRDPVRALQIAGGFGWAWVVLGDSRGAQRLAAALEAAGDAASPQERARALLLAAWILASTGDLRPATEHITAAAAIAEDEGDAELRARCCYYLAYVVSHGGDFREGLELADCSQRLYDSLDLPWDQAAAGLFAARAATSAGDADWAVQALDRVEACLLRVDDPWLHVRAEAARGELARLQHRFDDAVVHLRRAAEASHRQGFQQTEAYQLASLGRALCQTDDYEAGAATLQVAVEKAEAAGDARLAALSRVHLARVLRALGRTALARDAAEVTVSWHRATGGGEQALLGECLLAALDAADRRLGAQQRLQAILETARVHNDAPTEVLALDGLAGLAMAAGDTATATMLSRQADERMPAASHFITQRDRTDAVTQTHS
jgi:tetratricopeptide (TPR) repeat protein